MQSSEPDAELLALVKAAITQLAPAAQAACDLEYICDALTSLGCMRLIDLELFINGDILIAALAPTPIAFLLTLKRLALAALVGSAATPTAGTASPAPGAPPSFQTPMGTGTLEASTLIEPPRLRSWPSLGRFAPNFGMLLDLCGAHTKAHAKTRFP